MAAVACSAAGGEPPCSGQPRRRRPVIRCGTPDQSRRNIDQLKMFIPECCAARDCHRGGSDGSAAPASDNCASGVPTLEQPAAIEAARGCCATCDQSWRQKPSTAVGHSWELRGTVTAWQLLTSSRAAGAGGGGNRYTEKDGHLM